jgi:hypothetical protein
MKNCVGIWIDHKKAFIVLRDKEKGKITHLHSNVKGRVRPAGGSRSKTVCGPQEVTSEKKIKEGRMHHCKAYYQRVIEAVEKAQRILVLWSLVPVRQKPN